MPEQHKRFGGSTAARLIKCPGWLQANDPLPKEGKSSSFAQVGTDKHNIQEHLRNEELFPDEIDIAKIYPKLTQDEVEEYKQDTETAYDWTDTVLDQYNLETLVMEPYVLIDDETGGSIDVFAYNDTHVLVLDYKMGRIPVPAQGNYQGLFYHLALLRDPKFSKLVEGKTLLFTIIQPEQGEPSTWEIPEGELQAFEMLYNKAKQLSKQKNPPMAVSNECKFCRVKPVCKKYIEYGRRAITLDPKVKDSLTEALFLAEFMHDWSKKVFTFAQEVMEGGEQVVNYKLVAKRASRSWVNPAEVEAQLKGVRNKEQYFKHTLLTPPAMEKLKNVPPRLEKLFLDNTQKKSSGNTIAPESDKREAVTFQIPDNLRELINSCNK